LPVYDMRTVLSCIVTRTYISLVETFFKSDSGQLATAQRMNLAKCHQGGCCISHLVKASWPVLTHLSLSNLHRLNVQESRCGTKSLKVHASGAGRRVATFQHLYCGCQVPRDFWPQDIYVVNTCNAFSIARFPG